MTGPDLDTLSLDALLGARAALERVLVWGEPNDAVFVVRAAIDAELAARTGELVAA